LQYYGEQSLITKNKLNNKLINITDKIGV